MKNDFTSKWDECANQGWHAGIFRVFPEHFLDFFVGFSPAGEREFTFKWTEEKPTTESSYDLKQIEVLQSKNGEECCLVLKLINKDLSDLFSIVCFDLAQATRCANSPESGANIFFNRLKRWSDLLSKGSSKQMSFQERLGLMGELHMVDWITKNTNIPIDVVINGWRGPEGDTNDIGLNGSRLEIKAQLSTQPVGINVSSLSQLADDGRALYVVLHRFSVSTNGITLAHLVKEISTKIGINHNVLMNFQRKLILSGYDENEKYCNEAMHLDMQWVYEVNSEFPRLQPTSVPAGISKVSYFIEGSFISPFAIDLRKLQGLINEI